MMGVRSALKRILALGVPIALAAGLSLAPSQTSALPSQWIGSPPHLDLIRTLVPGEPIPYSVNGNRDCQQRSVVTRPARQVPTPQSEIKTTDCVINTAFGGYSLAGLLQRQGTDIFGELRGRVGGRLSAVPIPLSATLMYMQGPAGAGSYVYFLENAGAYLRSNVIATGEVDHKLTQDGTMLKDSSGSPVPLIYDSISFSANGVWMVADIPHVGVARINIATKEVLPFASTFNYGIGISPLAQTAITNDGRYAVVASTSFNRFEIYDLSTCSTPPLHPTTPVACEKRDLWPFMAQKIIGFRGVTRIRFIGGDSLQLYSIAKPANLTEVNQYVMYTNEKPFGNMQYLALGDSFASGEGAYNYKAITDTPDNKCHLSLRSYPYLIASSLNYNLTDSVACSGAKIEDLHTGSTDYLGQQGDKIKQKDRDNLQQITDSLLPGYLTQTSFLEPLKPQIITLSVSGNDIGFSDIIERCIGADTCYAHYEDRVELLQRINAQFYRLAELYSQIKSAADPRTKIYVIGYPQIVAPGNCGVNVHLNQDEIVFAQQLTNFLNDMIHRAADNAGVVYVDVEDALAGHRLCEATYSDLAVNGLTAGRDVVNFAFVHGPIGNESYHPNAMGHRLLAKVIAEKTGNFGRTAAKPQDTQPPPITDSLAILAAPKKQRPINKTIYRPVAPELIVKNSSFSISTDNAFSELSDVRIEIHSEPTFVGKTQSNGQGEVKATFTTPASLSPGYHTLHIYGLNTANQPIDVQQTVYVAQNQNDFNGDGVPNTLDPCLIFPPSYMDMDNDGIDDACDGTFNLTSPVQAVSQQSLFNNPLVGPAQGDSSTSQVLDATTPLVVSIPDGVVAAAVHTGVIPGEPTLPEGRNSWQALIPTAVLIGIGCMMLVVLKRAH
jgi:lysophospholipase L1-like esterase